MKSRDLGSAALSILAIWYLVRALSIAIAIGTSVGSYPESRLPLSLMVLSVAPSLLLGTILLALRRPLTSWLFDSGEAVLPEPEGFSQALVSAVGVVLAILGIAELAEAVAHLVPQGERAPSIFEVVQPNPTDLRVLAAPLAQTVAGVAVYLRAEGIVGGARALRQAGRKSDA